MNVTETFQQHVLPTYGRFPLVPVRGEGCRLWDETGKSYLDFCTGIAVCSIGTAGILNRCQKLLLVDAKGNTLATQN